MNDLTATLQVQMFGVFNVMYEGKPLSLGRNVSTKVMKLLQILLYHQKEGIGREKLLEYLYGREETMDASNNLRVTVHRLKKLLIDAGLPEYDYIAIKKGIYQWNSPIEVLVDALEFENLIEKANSEENEEKKAEMLERACYLYAGDFLSNMSGEEWVIVEAVRYKSLYSNALLRVCEYKSTREEYEDILKLCAAACEMYPFDEWQSVRIDCYLAMNRYKEALREYEETAKMLVEELGISPTPLMMEQFKIMSEKISNRPQEINEIKHELQEDGSENGAFFCTVPGFRDTYRVMRRCMERTGQSVFLLVCTLVDGKGRPMESSEKLEKMSDTLFESIKNSLRRSDSFTKYNPTQYLVMLLGTNEENCKIVIERIMNDFAKENKSWANYLDCRVSSLYEYPDEEDFTKINFGNM